MYYKPPDQILQTNKLRKKGNTQEAMFPPPRWTFTQAMVTCSANHFMAGLGHAILGNFAKFCFICKITAT